ncbi:MAG: glycine cleavage system H protein [Kiritimatiellia bacterium]|jgi:glycine cleavage system H protein
MDFPENLKYSDHDEWVRVEGDHIVVGISAFAQDALGELVHIEMLPEIGDTVEAGDAICEVESVKAVAEIYSPVNGEIVAFNEALEDEEDIVNNDPYGEGWLIKIKVTDASGLDSLLDVDAYKAKIEEA